MGLKMMLFYFHNTVNVKLGKPNFLLSQYNYKDNSLEESFKKFQETFSKKYDSGVTKTVTERMMEKYLLEVKKIILVGVVHQA